MTNVPFPTFGDTGFISPEELDILAGVMADLNAAFGGALNPSVSTPQGQLATSLAAVIGAFNDLFVDFTNQIDPAYAEGRMQDAIARIYYLSRYSAAPTVVNAVVSGATGAIIPTGSLARTSDNYIFASLSEVQIPASGSAIVQFAALQNGPIAVPVGALNTIYRSVAGWDSITNPTIGTPGRLEEKREDFERRRAQSVAINAIGIVPAIRGAVLDEARVPGIVDAYVTENVTDSNVVIGSQTILPHSIYVCVQGGTDADVGRAIWTKKSGGCNYSGSTTVTVYDNDPRYISPPSYSVSFQRAAALAINFVVQIKSSPEVPGNVNDLVTAAIAGAFTSQARIGQEQFASSYVCPIGALGSWARIVSLTVNGGDSVAVGINQFPTMGTVTVTLV